MPHGLDALSELLLRYKLHFIFDRGLTPFSSFRAITPQRGHRYILLDFEVGLFRFATDVNFHWSHLSGREKRCSLASQG